MESETNIKKEQKKSMYPERPSAQIEKLVPELQSIERGEREADKLNEEEKQELLAYEDKLGAELEKPFSTSIKECELCPDYFLTDEGREDFKKVTGVEIAGNSQVEIKQFVYTNLEKLKQAKYQDVNSLANRSVNYADEATYQALKVRAEQNKTTLTRAT